MMSTEKVWHPEDVKAEIRKGGETLRRLSLKARYDGSAASKALRQPWPAVERIIADFLGLEPQEIWPDRYLPDGSPRYLRKPRNPTHTRQLRKDVKSRAA